MSGRFEFYLDSKATIDTKLGQLINNNNQENKYVSFIAVKFCDHLQEQDNEVIFDYFLDTFLNKLTNNNEEIIMTTRLQKLKSLNFYCSGTAPVYLTMTRATKLLNILKKMIHKQPRTKTRTCRLMGMKLDLITLQCLYQKMNHLDTANKATNNTNSSLNSFRINLRDCKLIHGQHKMSCSVDNNDDEDDILQKCSLKNYEMGCQWDLEMIKRWMQQIIFQIEANTTLNCRDIAFDNTVFSVDAFQYILQQQQQQNSVNKKTINTNGNVQTSNQCYYNFEYINCKIFNETQNGSRRNIILKFSAENDLDHKFEGFREFLENDKVQNEINLSLLHITSTLQDANTPRQIIFENLILFLESIPTLLSYVTQSDCTRSNNLVVFRNCAIKNMGTITATSPSLSSSSSPSSSTTALPTPIWMFYDCNKQVLGLRASNINDPIIPTTNLLLTECPTFRPVKELQVEVIMNEDIADFVCTTCIKSLQFTCGEISNHLIKSLSLALGSNSNIEKFIITTGESDPTLVPSLEPFLDILKNNGMNMTLKELKVELLKCNRGFCVPFQKEINFYTCLNKFGRGKLLKSELSGTLFCLWLKKIWKYNNVETHEIKNGEKQGGSILQASIIYWMLSTFPHVLLLSIANDNKINIPSK